MSPLSTSSLSAAVLAAVLSFPANAGGSLDLSLSNETIRAAYDATKVGSGLHVIADIQHHTDDGDIASIGAHVVDVRNEDTGLYIGVGGKLYGFRTRGGDDNVNGGGVGLGGFFRYRIEQVPGLSVAGYGYYAPPVVSVSDAENLVDADARIQYDLIPTARVYVGYRYTGIRLEGVDDRYEIGDNGHIGLRIDF